MTIIRCPSQLATPPGTGDTGGKLAESVSNDSSVQFFFGRLFSGRDTTIGEDCGSLFENCRERHPDAEENRLLLYFIIE